MIREQRRFCVSILTHDQIGISVAMSRMGGDKFAGIDWTPSRTTDAPRIARAHAWVDCMLRQELPIGDHILVVCGVLEVDAQGSSAPLVFYRGEYHPVGPAYDL
jgi:3-hydroxy-9,10-secoandrosta-1,3,5(10)-triene-9,17-dione monooxygenase reductase component